MGAWEITNFSNDDALDFAGAFNSSPTPSVLATAMEEALVADYLEAPNASAALVAIEIVAACRNQPAKDIPQDLLDLLKGLPTLENSMAEKALLTLERLMEPDDNELYELYDEGGDIEAWLEVQQDLYRRLKN